MRQARYTFIMSELAAASLRGQTFRWESAIVDITAPQQVRCRHTNKLWKFVGVLLDTGRPPFRQTLKELTDTEKYRLPPLPMFEGKELDIFLKNPLSNPYYFLAEPYDDTKPVRAGIAAPCYHQIGAHKTTELPPNHKYYGKFRGAAVTLARDTRLPLITVSGSDTPKNELTSARLFMTLRTQLMEDLIDTPLFNLF